VRHGQALAKTTSKTTKGLNKGGIVGQNRALDKKNPEQLSMLWTLADDT
jgi:hypothetical protein